MALCSRKGIRERPPHLCPKPMASVLLRLTPCVGTWAPSTLPRPLWPDSRRRRPRGSDFRLLAEPGEGQDKERTYLEAWRPKFVLEKLERGWKAATRAGGGLPGVTRVRSARSHGPEPKPVGHSGSALSPFIRSFLAWHSRPCPVTHLRLAFPSTRTLSQDLWARSDCNPCPSRCFSTLFMALCSAHAPQGQQQTVTPLFHTAISEQPPWPHRGRVSCPGRQGAGDGGPLGEMR